jgi:lysophospholipase L1-like esterase
VKNFLLSIALTACSLFFVFIVLESYLILTSKASGSQDFSSRIVYRLSENADRKYEFIPGKSGWASGTKVSVNQDGHRGRAALTEEFDGTRILILGDSIAFGHGVTVEESFSDILHLNLNESGEKFEVLNLGVPGYDTIQEVAFLKDVAERYKPDYVLLMFCLNDLALVTINIEDLINPPTEKKSRYEIKTVSFVVNNINRITARYTARKMNETEIFREKYADRIDRIAEDETELLGQMEKVPNITYSKWFREKDRVGRLRYALNELSVIAEQQKFEAVLAIFPILMLEDGEYPHKEAHKVFKMEAESAGLQSIDVLDVLNESHLETFKLNNRDLIHPNVAGHLVLAKWFTQFYQGKSL